MYLSVQQELQVKYLNNRDKFENATDFFDYVYDRVVEKFEKELLRQSLEMHKWNQVQSASHLGITRNTLRAKIEKYKL